MNFKNQLKNEISYDFDILGPKVTVTDNAAVIENVKKIILISDEMMTCQTSRFMVSITGADLEINEIWEGRIELVGKLNGLEIFTSSG